MNQTGSKCSNSHLTKLIIGYVINEHNNCWSARIKSIAKLWALRNDSTSNKHHLRESWRKEWFGLAVERKLHWNDSFAHELYGVNGVVQSKWNKHMINVYHLWSSISNAVRMKWIHNTYTWINILLCEMWIKKHHGSDDNASCVRYNTLLVNDQITYSFLILNNWAHANNVQGCTIDKSFLRSSFWFHQELWSIGNESKSIEFETNVFFFFIQIIQFLR